MTTMHQFVEQYVKDNEPLEPDNLQKACEVAVMDQCSILNSVQARRAVLAIKGVLQYNRRFR